MARIIDGKLISKEIRSEIAEQVQKLKGTPHLTVVLVGEDPASQTYVRNKQRACEKVGISSETILLSESTSQDELLQRVSDLNQNPKINGLLVQLPLPKHIDENLIIESINPDKDVDCFHPLNIGKLTAGLECPFQPCTPAGIVELIYRSGYTVEKKHVVIVGRSNIVGKPLGLLLLRKGNRGDATITYCHSRTPDIQQYTRQADVLIAAVGYPELIKGDMIKPGAIVVDVGTNRVEDASHPKGYRWTGDVQFDEAEKVAEAITPVPGGVGPMTIAMLLNNTLYAYRNQTNE